MVCGAQRAAKVGPDGTPDWHYAEQLRLIDIDSRKKTLTVSRGCFGTTPLEFDAGHAYLAGHATGGSVGQAVQPHLVLQLRDNMPEGRSRPLVQRRFCR